MMVTLKSLILVSALAVAPLGFAQTPDATSPARTSGPTADNQKNDKTDIKLAADIRKSVYGDKTLSTMAHNVKIIARNGQVTLRGRVKSEDEKKAVVAKAEEIAGQGNVTDELRIPSAK